MYVHDNGMTLFVYSTHHSRGAGSILALVWCLYEYIAMLALHKEVLAMLVL